MTYYLIKYEEAAGYNMMGGAYELQDKTVETLKEAEEWVAGNYDDEYPSFVIEGEKIEFDFTRTVTAMAKAKA